MRDSQSRGQLGIFSFQKEHWKTFSLNVGLGLDCNVGQELCAHKLKYFLGNNEWLHSPKLVISTLDDNFLFLEVLPDIPLDNKRLAAMKN